PPRETAFFSFALFAPSRETAFFSFALFAPSREKGYGFLAEHRTKNNNDSWRRRFLLPRAEFANSIVV
ncbi:MAG: hypothetical protein DMG21_17115, partial [Acidobacteria bacterium]